MNNKGAINTHIAFTTLIVCIFIIAIFDIVIINSYSSVDSNFSLLQDFINDRSGLERLYGKFYNNISYSKDTYYEDLDKTYKIIEDKVIYNDIVETLPYSGSTTFYINNKTDIIIDINYSRYTDLEPGEPSYYTINLTCNNKVILNETLSSGTIITIPSSLIYNEETEKYNYGEYILTLNGVNCNVSANINYKEQTYKKNIIIENDKITRTLILENDIKNKNTKIYFINE